MLRKLIFLVVFAFFDVVFAVFFLESLDAAGRIDVLLLSGIKRVAHRAYLGVYFFGCASGLERIAAAAMYDNLIVFWMDIFLHNLINSIT